MTAGAGRRVLLLSENAPVPNDRRVWNECRTLTAAGWEVVVVCPQGPGDSASPNAVIEGVEVHRYPLVPSGGGALGYLREYGQAMWRMWRLVRRLERAQHFDVVHAANPPDFLLLTARLPRRRGARLVFDHHDLVPELYRSRFGAGKNLFYRASLAFERFAFRMADVSIATNETYRGIAIERGGMSPEDVFVVRNGPDLSRLYEVPGDPSLKRGSAHLIVYLGVMGPQDGIDHAIRALAHLRGRRRDWHAIFIGEGDAVDPMRALAGQLGLSTAVEFAGWRGDEDIRRIVSTADVCLAPDPPSPLNDASTMVKIPEYLGMGRPVVSYGLPESRVSAGPAARYAESPTPECLGDCISELLDDPAQREEMGRIGRERAVGELAWSHSEQHLLRAYERALAKQVRAATARPRGRADLPATARPGA